MVYWHCYRQTNRLIILSGAWKRTDHIQELCWHNLSQLPFHLLGKIQCQKKVELPNLQVLKFSRLKQSLRAGSRTTICIIFPLMHHQMQAIKSSPLDLVVSVKSPNILLKNNIVNLRCLLLKYTSSCQDFPNIIICVHICIKIHVTDHKKCSSTIFNTFRLLYYH